MLKLPGSDSVTHLLPPLPSKNPSKLPEDSQKSSIPSLKTPDLLSVKPPSSPNRKKTSNSTIERKLRNSQNLVIKTAQLTPAECKLENSTQAIINLVDKSRLPETEKTELINHIKNGVIDLPEKLKIDFLIKKLTACTGEPSRQLSETANRLLENQDRLSPTDAWQHKYREDLDSAWDADCYSKLPCNIEQLIQEETTCLNTHVPFYHAHTDNIQPCQTLIEALIQSSTQHIGEKQWPRETQWCRNPFEKPRGAICHNANDMKDMLNRLSGKDNSDIGKWHMLSCNPSFFQNTNRDAMESTADYLHDNNSVAAPDDKEFFNKLLDDAGLLTKPESKNIRDKLHQELKESYEKAGSDKKGVLWQIFVPHHLVDDVAYISGDNGVPDLKNPNTLETLLQLQLQHKAAESDLPSNHKKLQVRLSTSLMHDPTISPQLKIQKYGPLPEQSMAEFKQKTSIIATDIIAHSLKEQLPNTKDISRPA